VFSFIAGISVSEYIRRRRLSQAVFDIQKGKESIIDIALKYCYESQSAFTRAFKELHGHTPASSRKIGVSLKTYPKITFKLVVKGVVEMDFKIVNKESFKIIGYKCSGEWNDWVYFNKHFDPQLRNNITEKNYYKAPFWQVGAYKFNPPGEVGTCDDFEKEYKCIIGAELTEEPILRGMDVEEFPAATWAIFAVEYDPHNDSTGKTYAKVLSEWFPVSNYKRDENIPYLEVYSIPGEADAKQFRCEIWIPIINK
jgi:AraC family transcriptional regulator